MIDNWFKENLDFKTIAPVVLLTLIGIIAVYSATYDAGASLYFNRHLLWSGIGIIIMIVLVFVPFRSLQLISYPLYGFSILLLIAVLGAGKVIAGSRSWFGIGGYGFQPSEFVKITTVLALAAYLSDPQVQIEKIKHLAVIFGLVLLPVFLISLQPDIGTAIIYLCMLVIIIYWAGASNFLMLSLIAPAAAAIASLFGTTPFLIVIGLTLLILFLLRENRFLSAIVFSGTVLFGVSVQFIFSKLATHQQNRIISFLNPEADPQGTGYNVIQSQIAIGSGGIFGKGFLHGSQTQLNFIPAQWTDFIYCVPSEEFGFLGAFTILLLLTLLLIRGVQIASFVKNRYASLVAIGIVSALATHMVINIGMSMGIMPVIGVPLPFISYGGSNLISNFIMAGLLLNVYANRKEY